MKTSNLKKVPENRITLKFSLDRYTKFTLTIIAVCLFLIVANMYIKPSNLNALETVQDVNIKYVNGSSLWGGELPVNLEQVNGRSVYDKLPVDIQSVNGNSIFGSELPVKVKN